VVFCRARLHLTVDFLIQGRTNISPDKVPWDALRTLLTQAIYGGRIDNEFDQVKIYFLLKNRNIQDKNIVLCFIPILFCCSDCFHRS
jgi:hypothetical protein